MPEDEEDDDLPFWPIQSLNISAIQKDPENIIQNLKASLAKK